jgi:hypothetical protein
MFMRFNNQKKIQMKFKKLFEKVIDAVSSFHFYDLEDEVAQFIKDNKKAGLDDLGYCDLKLSIAKNETYEAIIRAYYRTSHNDKFIEKKKVITFDNLKNIPQNISKIISEKGNITIKIEDIVDLLSEEITNLKDPIAFDELLTKVDHRIKELNIDSQKFNLNIAIEDKIFYKKVFVIYTPTEKTGIQGKKMIYYYSDISDLPIDVYEKLNNEGKVEMALAEN